MAGIPDDKLQELRDRIDIVDLIGRYVGLTRTGKNHKACCPFHSEKTPSFYVNPERKSYKCFGCGVYGDGIQFVMELEGLGFVEAARKLAELYGVQLPSTGPPERSAARHAEREAAFSVLRCAVDLYREILLHAPEGASARAYQQARNIAPETAEIFQLGYAPAPAEAGWDRLARTLAARNLPLELAERLGLVARSERTGAYFDKFRGRLMFPIVKPGGACVGFSGRILPEHDEAEGERTIPKYTNSPESLLYKKSKTLFGLHAASPSIRRRGRAILVEGNVDVLSMHQRGFTETVAPLGTSLTAAQVEALARFTDTVVLCFDGDAAGVKAAHAAIPVLLDHGLDARLIALAPGEDPDSVDPARLQNLFERPRAALEWLLERMVERGATESFDAQARALGAIAPLLRKVKREAARDLYVDRAAKLLNLSPHRISALLRGRGDPRPPDRFDPRPRDVNAGSPAHASPPQRPLPELPGVQAKLTTLLVDNPHLAGAAEDAGVLEHVTDRRLEPITRAVLTAARQGEHPSEGELLELIDPRAHRQVHDIVFSGAYRDTDLDPREVLADCIRGCKRHALRRKRDQAALEMRRAQDRGDMDRVRELSIERVALNRQLNELERQQVPPRR